MKKIYFYDGIAKEANPKVNLKEAYSERTAELRWRQMEQQCSFSNSLEDWLGEKRRVSVFCEG